MAEYKFSGGEKLAAKLKDLAARANKDALLKVGFFEGSTENKSGVSTAYVASINEFGGTVPERAVPAHKATIYKRVGKAGNILNKGRFVKRNSKNAQSVEVDVPEHVIPEHTIPSRPFFRRMIKLGQEHWGDDLAQKLDKYDGNVDLAMEDMGIQMVEELQESIQAPVYEPNSAATIARKGHGQTLVDSGDMWNAVAYQIEE